MDKNKCKVKELRDIQISIRVTRSMSEFMRDNQLSPSQIMVEALRELGYK
jgi:hypothetical protein